MEPHHIEAARLLARVLRKAHRWAEALTAADAALALDPRHFPTAHGRAITLSQLGRTSDAVTAFEHALALHPGSADGWSNYALSLRELGDVDACAAAHDRAIDLRPDDVALHLARANSMTEAGRFDAALASVALAYALAPHSTEARERLERTLNRQASTPLDQGEAARAVRLYRRLRAVAPRHARYTSNFLFALHYDETQNAETIRADHAAAAATFGAPATVPRRTGTDRLRIGYVSPNLSAHPVGSFLLPVFPHHDTKNFEIVVYSDRREEDRITRKLASAGHRWHRSADWSHERLRETILRDQIDILVDLAGHTALNRMPVFGARAAPVQVSWAGYVGTTGLPAMDWLIADRWHAPPGREFEFTERVWRMPNGYVPWAPPGYAPEVSNLPHLSGEAFTFGCLNRISKATPAAIARWAHVLAATPRTRMLFADNAFQSDDFRRGFVERFHAHGIDAARLILLPGASHADFLALYHRIDLALDPTPYAGGATTLEAMWMGVPVLTTLGDRFSGRHSTSHLSQAGLTHWITASEQEYIERAVATVADPRPLADERRTLRQRLAAAPACDGPGFTRDLETAFRAMWDAR